MAGPGPPASPVLDFALASSEGHVRVEEGIGDLREHMTRLLPELTSRGNVDLVEYPYAE